MILVLTSQWVYVNDTHLGWCDNVVHRQGVMLNSLWREVIDYLEIMHQGHNYCFRCDVAQVAEDAKFQLTQEIILANSLP